MQRTGYDRFALTSNPFHDLASEGLQETEVFHVAQEADEAFERMKQEVLDGSRKAFVLVSGPLGSGKTQRLRVTLAQAEAAGAFALYLNLAEAPPEPLAAIASGIAEAAAKRKAVKGFAGRRWLRTLKSLAKGKAIAAESAGRRLAEALTALSPAYILLNDLDMLHGPPRERLLQALLGLVSNMPSGVMVCMGCQPGHVDPLTEQDPALASRLNRVVKIRGLPDEDAGRPLAKRLAGKRLIERLDRLSPCRAPAAADINTAAGGSPRRLLQLADLVLDGAVKERAFQIGPGVAAS